MRCLLTLIKKSSSLCETGIVGHVHHDYVLILILFKKYSIKEILFNFKFKINQKADNTYSNIWCELKKILKAY